MQHNESYKDIQRRLAEYCKTTQSEEIPGIYSKDRLDTYRGLVFNAVSNALDSAYPIAKKAMGPDSWSKLVNDFFADYDSGSPELWRMPYGLFDYVSNNREDLVSHYPFLIDLLKFEWIEIEVFMMEDLNTNSYQKMGDILKDNLVLNFEHCISDYRYPVFKTKVDDIQSLREQEPAQYFLFSFRHPETLSVKFLELSPLHIATLQTLLESPCTGEAAFLSAAAKFGLEPTNEVIAGARAFLDMLLKERAILGFSNN